SGSHGELGGAAVASSWMGCGRGSSPEPGGCDLDLRPPQPPQDDRWSPPLEGVHGSGRQSGWVIVPTLAWSTLTMSLPKVSNRKERTGGSPGQLRAGATTGGPSGGAAGS